MDCKTLGVAEQKKISNTVSFGLTNGQPYKTGLKKAGIYKWMFTSVNYTAPLYFILTVTSSSYGILKLNETWFSGNVILSVDSTTQELVIQYNSSNQLVVLEYIG